MKVRRNEVLVGAAILAALVVLVAGALWLGEVQLGGDRSVHTALFRSVGGLGVGDQVSLRGVRIGRVDAIRLAEDNWVAVDLRLDPDVPLPTGPGAVVMPSTLFGEWEVTVVSRDAPPLWRAGGALMQRVAGDAARGDTAEDWNRSSILFASTRDEELIDPALGADRLLYRLFHEEGARMAKPAPLDFHGASSRSLTFLTNRPR